MNPKIRKLTGDIEKTREKITDLRTRLREMEDQKLELENAEIIALVRSINVAPSEFADFVLAYRAGDSNIVIQTQKYEQTREVPKYEE